MHGIASVLLHLRRGSVSVLGLISAGQLSHMRLKKLCLFPAVRACRGAVLPGAKPQPRDRGRRRWAGWPGDGLSDPGCL